MLKTQRLIVTCLVLAAGLGVGFVLFKLMTFEVANVPPPLVLPVTSQEKQREIIEALKLDLAARGVKTAGLSPYLLLEHYPSLVEDDFGGAEAVIGKYEIDNGTLTYQSGETVSDAAATDLSDAGFSLFLNKYSNRTGLNVVDSSSKEIIRHFLKTETTDGPDMATSTDDFVSCTMDAKQCPDGSYVGRTGPNCEFAACGGEVSAPKTVTCTPEQKQAEACIEIYQPVCASVQIQCITTPCEPIPKTFGNSCEACSENSVTQYTEGACAGVAPAI